MGLPLGKLFDDPPPSIQELDLLSLSLSESYDDLLSTIRSRRIHCVLNCCCYETALNMYLYEKRLEVFR
jgi:hypothetical protein